MEGSQSGRGSIFSSLGLWIVNSFLKIDPYRTLTPESSDSQGLFLEGRVKGPLLKYPSYLSCSWAIPCY
jgi:hypothetical protein